MMMNILRYFYQIIIDNEDDIQKGVFSYHNHLFYLQKYTRNLDEIKEILSLINDLSIQNIIFNRIILNINQEALTFYENNYYVLFEINDYRKNSFKSIPIIHYLKYPLLRRDNWAYFWEKKIDYVEYQISHLENKYSLLDESIDYYIGMTENAISYFKMLQIKEPLYLSHRRMNNIDLDNPLELVIDYKVRDIAEYMKYLFFYENKNIKLKEFLLDFNFNEIDYLLFYIRMLYPSYYFDIYDKIIKNELEEEKINDITNLSCDYERFLYEIYILIKEHAHILNVTWINENFL